MSIQEQTRNYQQRAYERGVVAARRPISSEDQIMLQGITEILARKIRKAGHLIKADRIGVTVVGLGRIDDRHRRDGPATSEITNEVASTHIPLELGLGKLGIYGTESVRKLGIDFRPSVDSDILALEKRRIEAGFENEGFPLEEGPDRPGGYIQHVSIGVIAINNYDYFRNPGIMEGLEAVTGLGPRSTLSIVAEPVSALPPTRPIY